MHLLLHRDALGFDLVGDRVELIFIGSGRDDPIPRFEVHQLGDFFTRLEIAGILPGVTTFGHVAGRQRQGFIADVLDERLSVGVFGVADIFAVARPVL